MARFDPRLVQYDAAQTERFYKLLIERMRAAPGVRSAALAREPAARPGRVRPHRLRAGRFHDAARPRELHRDDRTPSTRATSRRWGYRSLRGRGFRHSDSAGAPRVAVVNEQFAHHYWPDRRCARQAYPARRRDRHRRWRSSASRRRSSTGIRARSRWTSFTCRLPSTGRAHGPADAVERRAAAARRARSRKSCAASIANLPMRGDADLRGPVPVPRGGRPAVRHQARHGHGRRGPAARDRRPLRPGVLQRQPPHPRDRHPHRDRRRTARRAAADDGQGPDAGWDRHGDRPGDGFRRRAAHELHACSTRAASTSWPTSSWCRRCSW